MKFLSILVFHSPPYLVNFSIRKKMIYQKLNYRIIYLSHKKFVYLKLYLKSVKKYPTKLQIKKLILYKLRLQENNKIKQSNLHIEHFVHYHLYLHPCIYQICQILPTLMHHINVFCHVLKSYWVSLTSKKQFFDAPVRDTRPILNSGGFRA